MDYHTFKRQFYRTTEWKKLRAFIRKRDEYRCQDCKRLLYKSKWSVDHIVEIGPSNYKDRGITHGPSNLQLLCEPCHNKKHNRFVSFNLVDRRGDVNFDSREERLNYLMSRKK